MYETDYLNHHPNYDERHFVYTITKEELVFLFKITSINEFAEILEYTQGFSKRVYTLIHFCIENLVSTMKKFLQRERS